MESYQEHKIKWYCALCCFQQSPLIFVPTLIMDYIRQTTRICWNGEGMGYFHNYSRTREINPLGFPYNTDPPLTYIIVFIIQNLIHTGIVWVLSHEYIYICKTFVLIRDNNCVSYYNNRITTPETLHGSHPILFWASNYDDKNLCSFVDGLRY